MKENKKDFLSVFFRYPWLVVAAILALTAFFAFQLPRAELDNDNIRFIPENDEARLASDFIDDTFGSSLFMLVALEREYGDVFERAFLNRIREFNARIEEYEMVGEINSIVSSDYIFAEESSAEGGFSEPGAIVVQKLVGEDFSGTPEEIALLKRRLLSWDIYRRSLVSDDFGATQILIPLDLSDEAASRPEMIAGFIEIRDIAKEMFKGYAEVYVTGLPIISAAVNEAMKADLVLMIPIVALITLLVLFFSFRRFAPALLPFAAVIAAVIWSMGAMPLFGIKLSVVSTALPAILMAVGSAYGIHIVTHYLEETGAKAGSLPVPMSREEHRLLVLSVLRKIGKAVFLAALTTLAGFSSFCFTRALPIREFGFFSAFGVIASFAAAATLIPALLIIRGPPRAKAGEAESGKARGRNAESRAESAAARFFFRVAGKRASVLCAAALVVLFSLWGISKLRIDNVFVEYFKTGSDIYRSDRFIRERFGGSKIVSVVVQADDSETLLMPETLGAMDDLNAYLEEKVGEVGKTMGFTDLVKRINQVFNAGESPEGVKSAAAASADAGAFGFDGFGFDEAGFGFDEAGFEDASADETAAIPGAAGLFDAETPDAPRGRNGEDPLGAGELLGLLREAADSGKSRSMDAQSLVREMEKRLNYEGAAYYEIPRDPARYGKTSPGELSSLIANYLVLLSGNIDAYANDPLSPTAVKTTVQLRTLGDEDTGRAIARIRAFIKDNFPKTVTATIGGSALVESSLNRLVVQSQLVSVIFSVLMVFAIVALSNRSLVAGAIGVIPLLISILVNFAVMGLLGIKVNIGTSMVASVSVGIGIDYTIHFIEAYKREYLASRGSAGGSDNGTDGRFLIRTFAASGKAILVNAVSVGAGFAALLFSQFVMLKDLGLLIALTMATSALASLTLIPVLLRAIRPRFIYGK